LSAGLPQDTNAVAEDPEKWSRWEQIVIATSTDPAIVDLSEHILHIGRKE
jgi:hypothetical protein